MILNLCKSWSPDHVEHQESCIGFEMQKILQKSDVIKTDSKNPLQTQYYITTAFVSFFYESVFRLKIVGHGR